MADDRDSLLREVDEELRREQMQKIWERYNSVIIGAAALIVVGVGGYKSWHNSTIAAAEANGAKFEQAVRLSDEKKTEDAAKAFEEVAASGASGYGALARLNIAGTLAKSGKTARAVEAYELLAKGSAGDKLLRDFAALQAASLRMGDADFTEMQNRLKALTGADQPFRTSASELLGIAAYKAGKFPEARDLLEPLLIDPAAARPIQERIKIVLADIASTELAKPAAEAPKTADPAPAATETPPAAAEPEKK